MRRLTTLVVGLLLCLVIDASALEKDKASSFLTHPSLSGPPTEANGSSKSDNIQSVAGVHSLNVTVFNGFGMWTNPMNWSNGVPTNSDSAVIAGGNVVMLGVEDTVASLNIMSGATLTIMPTMLQLSPGVRVTNTLRVDGTLTGLGTVGYGILPAIPLNKTIYGSGAIDVSIFFAICQTLIYQPDVTVSAMQVVTLGLLAGNLLPGNPNAIFTVQGTQLMEPTFVAEYLGIDPEKFIYKSYINPTLSGPSGAWFNLGPPIQHFPIAQFENQNPFATHTFNNSVPNGSSLYLYDPTDQTWPVNQGYIKAPNIAYTLSDAQGVRVWISSQRLTMGPLVYNGLPYPFGTPTLLPLAYCASGCTYGSTNGYNLIKNPFIGAVRSSSFTYTNTASANWVWSNSQNNFASFVGGIGVNNGRDEIAAGQAFWVRTTGSGASIEINPYTTLIAQFGPTYPVKSNRVINDVVRLKLMDGTTMKDETAVRLEPTATARQDDAFDAAKFEASGANISTLLPDGTKMGINTLPINGVVRIPVALTNYNANQNLELGVALEHMTPQHQVYLNHPSFATPMPLTNGQRFTIDPAWTSGLELVIMNSSVTSLDKVLNPSLTLSPNPATTSVELHLAGSVLNKVSVLDQLGRTVLVVNSLTSDMLDISALAAGSYIVHVATDKGVVTQRLSVVR